MKKSHYPRPERVSVKMKLRSVQLPNYVADVVDLSARGAKLRLADVPTQTLEEERIRFAASLPEQVGHAFEGYARVAWLKKTPSGIFAGLEWEKMTKSAWLAVKAALVQAAL